MKLLHDVGEVSCKRRRISSMSIDLLSLVNTRLALNIARSSLDLESCRFLDRSNARNKVLLDIGSPKNWSSTHLQSQNWVYPLPPRVLGVIHCPVRFIVNYFRQFFLIFYVHQGGLKYIQNEYLVKSITICLIIISSYVVDIICIIVHLENVLICTRNP